MHRMPNASHPARSDDPATTALLEYERNRYAALVRATGNLVWTNSPAGEMVGDQPDWCAYTGQTLAECRGYGWSKAVHPEDAPATIEAWKKAVEQRSTFLFEHRLRRADGEYVWFAIRAVPILWPDGSLREWVGLHRDIHAEKLAAGRLDEARQAAEAANRTKDEFLAMLGHELRNPLAPITTALQLMKLRGAGQLEAERSIIERQVNHLVILVDDLLDIARITGGKTELSCERLELGDVIDRALELAGPLITQRGHVVCAEVARGLVVDGDAHRLAQVFANILTNAARYTPSGGRIKVVGTRVGGEAVLEVTDTGMGIAPHLLPRVFERFVQGPQALNRDRGGLGLGLAIVSHLVQLHGGRVDVASEGTGHGATFTVRLPIALRAQAPAPAQERLVTPKAAGKRVLVVDDNEDAADLLASALELFGYETRKANEAATALQIVGDFRPHVALLDIGLPKMNGYELAKALRGRTDLAPLRLVALTGYGQDGDRVRAREAGFDAHAVKPVDFERLTQLIEAPAVAAPYR